MTDTQAQEAARLADLVEWLSNYCARPIDPDLHHLPMLRALLSRITDLQAELAALRAQLARMREPLYEALVRLLGSDPDGAIANASEDELTGAANDANADPVIREQAASVLQARAAAREYEAAHGITKTGGGV